MLGLKSNIAILFLLSAPLFDVCGAAGDDFEFFTDKDLRMPHKDKKLPESQIADLAAWVKMGAPDPRTAEPRSGGTASAKAKTWWAFQPVQKPNVPGRGHRNPIDTFIDEKLAAAGLKKAP